MKRTKMINLPIAGILQHGIHDGKRVKELGHFITKTKNSNMEFLINKFNEKFKDTKQIIIRFFDENPLTIRQIRYNQAGAVCYCLEQNKNGKEKTKNGWRDINCKDDCEYRLSQNGQKPLCNREGVLKFIIPDITTDRIFIMRIRGQTSINRLDDYINFRKMQGKPIVGDYVLTLNKEQQTNKEGQKFQNYLLDINRKEDFVSNTTNKNDKSKPKEDLVSSKKTNVKKPKEQVKAEEKQDDKNNTFDDYYTLLSTKHEKILNNNKKTDYLIAKVCTIEDKQLDVVIPHEYAKDLEECDLGTVLKLEVSKTKNDRLFTKTLEFIDKKIKNVAA